MAWLCPTQVYVALCRLSQSSDAAARDAVRQGIDLMISNLAQAVANDASASTSVSHAAVSALTLEGAAESLLSKDSATSEAGTAGTAAPGTASLTASPSYARYLKRVLSEDGHVSLTLVHVLQIIVRNRDMFYSNR